MRGALASVGVEVGHEPMVVESGTLHTTVKMHNAIVTLHGTRAERREFVLELARELGLASAMALEEMGRS